MFVFNVCLPTVKVEERPIITKLNQTIEPSLTCCSFVSTTFNCKWNRVNFLLFLYSNIFTFTRNCCPCVSGEILRTDYHMHVHTKIIVENYMLQIFYIAKTSHYDKCMWENTSD